MLGFEEQLGVNYIKLHYVYELKSHVLFNDWNDFNVASHRFIPSEIILYQHCEE